MRNVEDRIRGRGLATCNVFPIETIIPFIQCVSDVKVGELGLASNAHQQGCCTFVPVVAGCGGPPGSPLDLAGGLDGAFPIVWEGPDNVFGLDVAYLSRTASSGRHHSLGIPTWA